jgi:hypothetical protein
MHAGQIVHAACSGVAWRCCTRLRTKDVLWCLPACLLACLCKSGSAASYRTANSRGTTGSGSSRLSASASAKEFPRAFVPTVDDGSSDEASADLR